MDCSLTQTAPGEVCEWGAGSKIDNEDDEVTIIAPTVLLFLAIAVSSYFLYTLSQRFLFWRYIRRGSKAARIAASTLRQLRSSCPDLYPSSRHVWCTGTRDVEVSTSPLLCVACCGHIDPLNQNISLNSCSVCGVVAHDGCLRHVEDTCRPASTPPQSQQHFWQIAGTTRMENGNEPNTSSTTKTINPNVLLQSKGVESCLYCGEDGVWSGIVAAEPVWRCSFCFKLTHVRCFCASHPKLSKVIAKYESKIKMSKVLDARNENNLDYSDNGELSPIASPKSSPTMHNENAKTWDVIGEERIHTLDTCTLGPLQRLILPSSSVLNKKRGHAEQRQQQETGSSVGATTKTSFMPDGGSNNADDKEQNNNNSKNNDGCGNNNDDDYRKKVKLRKTKPSRKLVSWWHRALSRPQLHWSDWTLRLPLPQNCKPLLVFVNVKSGPQVGEILYRRFLGKLHPLQVVCLPREPPDPALRMFACIPGVRILCVGGDGTAGWIMSCIDTLANERKGRDWVAPSVAVLPVGTGNDLARCLGWGGGYGSWRQEGVSCILNAVAEASVALLDRWTLTFTVDGLKTLNPKTGSKLGANTETTDSGLGLRQHTASAPSSSSPSRVSGPKQRINLCTYKNEKAMNNYLGLGIDAKVALDFHEMREAYPQWFQSQFGNKMVYTGVGALDFFTGGQLNLPQKVKIWCDGDQVPLPPGAEGVLIVNIPSYMGGVNLWASGAEDIPTRDDDDDNNSNDNNHSSNNSNYQVDKDGRHNLNGILFKHQGHNTHKPGPDCGVQSMCDGKLEILAVGGSWHLGQLQIGLSRAVRLRQGHRIVIQTSETLPMQVDGEPFVQPAGEVSVSYRGQSRVLRRVEDKPVARVLRMVEETLESAADQGIITLAQHDALAEKLAASIHAPQL